MINNNLSTLCFPLFDWFKLNVPWNVVTSVIYFSKNDPKVTEWKDFLGFTDSFGYSVDRSALRGSITLNQCRVRTVHCDQKFNYIHHGHECYGNFELLMISLNCSLSSIQLYYFRGIRLNLFEFSLIHTGPQLYKQTQIDLFTHLNILINGAGGSTMAFK